MSPTRSTETIAPLTLRSESPLTNRLTAAAAFALANTMAHAQDATPPAATNTVTKLPEVLVTDTQERNYKTDTAASPKYTEPLRDIPQTITVIPKAIIEEQGATTLSDALRNIPSVTMLAGEGGGASSTAGDAFFMRGADATSSIFVDGVRNQGLISRDTYNVEQIDVFAGPTGSDIGRGTAAGYINIATKIPTLAPLYSGTLGYGSADQKRFTLDVNQPVPLGEKGDWINGSAVRLNAMWQEGGIPGRDEVERERYAIAPSIALGLGTPTRVILSAEHVKQDNIPDYGISGAALTNNAVDWEGYYGILGFDKEDVEANSITARFEHDLTDNITLRNQTHYGMVDRYAIITSPNAVTNIAGQTFAVRSRQGNERKNEIFSNQTGATAEFFTGRMEHHLAGGVEYMWERQYSPTLGGIGTAPPANVLNPNPHDPVTGYAPFHTGAYTEGETETVSAYVFDTVHLTSKWLLNGGVRWDHYQTEFKSVSTTNTFIAGTPITGSDNLFSWKAGLTFKPLENGSIYFSYGRSFTPPGGPNFNFSTNNGNINNPATKPQESEAFQFGTKWEFLDSRLATTLAIFRTINRNEISAVAGTTDQFTYDRERMVEGVELSIAGRITENWQISANAAYLNTEFKESDTPTTDGAQLQWTPEYSASVWTTYRFPFRLTLGGGVRYVSTVPRATSNAQGFNPEMPDYYVLDAMAQYEFNEHFSLRLNVYNLLDEQYVSSLNNNGNRFYRGAPLSFMLTGTVKF